MSDIIIASALSSSKPARRRAQEDFWWLWSYRENLNDEERSRVVAFYHSQEWKKAGFDWLEKKRRKYDSQYDELRDLQIKEATTYNKIKEIEQRDAQEKLEREESTGLPELNNDQMKAVWEYVINKETPSMRWVHLGQYRKRYGYTKELAAWIKEL